MPTDGKHPDELRERAGRMDLDHGHESGWQWQAICSVAEKLGPKTETVSLWVRQAGRDRGRRPGATTDEVAEVKRLKLENAELRRADDLLKAAAHFFGAELDRQSKEKSSSPTNTRICAAVSCSGESSRSPKCLSSPRPRITPLGHVRRRHGRCVTPNYARRSCGCGKGTWPSTAPT